MKIFKVKDIPNGSILWKGQSVIGIKGAALPKKYDEYNCYQEQGNPLDFTIMIPLKAKKEKENETN